MAVFRVIKNENYTTMSNFHLRDSGLSLKAKGLLSQMLSLPENWDYTLSGLAAINKEGKDAIRSAVQELEQAGYIRRRQTHDETGNFAGNEYVIHEQPVFDAPEPGGGGPEAPGDDQIALPLSDYPTTENPLTENPSPENPTELNKDRSSKEEIEKKNKKEKTKGRRALSDAELRTQFVEWISATAGEYWSKRDKNALYLALGEFYMPRENKRQEPARTVQAVNALLNRLLRLSKGDVRKMVDLLETATSAAWRTVYGRDMPPEAPPDRRDEEWL